MVLSALFRALGVLYRLRRSLFHGRLDLYLQSSPALETGFAEKICVFEGKPNVKSRCENGAAISVEFTVQNSDDKKDGAWCTKGVYAARGGPNNLRVFESSEGDKEVGHNISLPKTKVQIYLPVL